MIDLRNFGFEIGIGSIYRNCQCFDSSASQMEMEAFGETDFYLGIQILQYLEKYTFNLFVVGALPLCSLHFAENFVVALVTD